MKVSKDLVISLGFLAGTTLGSGLAFLFQLQGYEVIGSVALCGLTGVAAGFGIYLYQGRSIRSKHS